MEQRTPYERRLVLLKAADLLETDRYHQKIQQTTRDETAQAEPMKWVDYYGSIAVLRDSAGVATELKERIILLGLLADRLW